MAIALSQILILDTSECYWSSTLWTRLTIVNTHSTANPQASQTIDLRRGYQYSLLVLTPPLNANALLSNLFAETAETYVKNPRWSQKIARCMSFNMTILISIQKAFVLKASHTSDLGSELVYHMRICLFSHTLKEANVSLRSCLQAKYSNKSHAMSILHHHL